MSMDTIGIMARHRRRLGRFGRILKWSGLICGLIPAATIPLSKWWHVNLIADGDSPAFIVYDGQVLYRNCWWNDRPGFSVNRRPNPTPLRWSFHYRSWPARTDSFPSGKRDPASIRDVRCWRLSVPLWIPLATIAIPTIWLWRRDRGFPDGHCQRCGYDLTGNVSGKCSECGTAT